MPKPKQETAAQKSAQQKSRANPKAQGSANEQVQAVQQKRTRAQRNEPQAAHNTSPKSPRPARRQTDAAQNGPQADQAPKRTAKKPTSPAKPGARPQKAVPAIEAEPVQAQPETVLATPPPTRGRGKKASAPEAVASIETAPVEQTPVEPTPAVKTPAKPRRGGRTTKVQPKVAQTAALPTPEPVQAVTPTEEAAPTPKRGRGRKPQAEPEVRQEATLESVDPTSEVNLAQDELTPRLTEESSPREEDLAVQANALPEASAPAPRQNRRGRKGETPSQPSTPARPKRGRREQGEVQTSFDDGSHALEAVLESVPVEEVVNERPATPEPAPIVITNPREAVIEQLRTVGRPMHVRDFERSFPREVRRALNGVDVEDILSELMREGQVIRTRRRTYGLPEAMNLTRGRFQSSASGFGFVIPENGGADFYVAPDATMDAWNGDTVLVRAEGQGRKGDSPRATVVRIVNRATSQLVGSLERARSYALIKADDLRARHRIMLAQEGLDELKAGTRIVAQLYWPEQTGEDEVYGVLSRVLGDADDPETETRAVIVKYGLHDEFPAPALKQAEKIAVKIPKTALKGRLDLRQQNVFTVDGADAKDFDDAIHIEPLDGGRFRVGVHIADVSHYVGAGTALDKEAFERATSVYLPGHVLPMLPEHLSNGVCSLVPGEDRLTLSAMIEVSADGDVLSYVLTPSVIHSQARLTYDEVQAYSEARGVLPEHARRVEGDLHLLLKLTSRMRQKRLRAGSLDFQMREVKVDVDRAGNLHLIPIREETARGMIEDLMLLANQVVARFLLERNAPALYRVHEEPTQGRFAEVSAALARMGIELGSEPTPQAYQNALKQVRGTSQESAVNSLLLRSLKQARYSAENLGHFGLAFEEYLHFTSPIRRYPDLVVHRMLRAELAGQSRSAEVEATRAELPGMADHTSDRERKATEAERDLTKYYQAKWAQTQLGESFTGTVSGVTSFGLFVALENGVEGLLHISNLDDDYYVFIEEALMLRGRSSGRTFRLGTEVEIVISQVNPLARQIDFTQETDMNAGNKARARSREEQAARQGKQADTNQEPVQAGGQPQGRREDQNRQAQQGPRSRSTPQPQQGGRANNARGNAQQGGGNRRRIVTLDRPRNEHARPVNVTVHRMYFGDWSLDNMPPEEEERGGGNFRGGRPSGNRPPQAQGSRQGKQGSGQQAQPQSRPAAQASAPSSNPGGESGDAAKRRRRRRGRRKGNGNGGEG